MNTTVTVEASSGKYEVIIGEKLNYAELLRNIKSICNVVLVSDDTVASLYADECKEQLEQAGYQVETFVFSHGEEQKSMKTAYELLEFCADFKLTRSDLLIALGGGVVGDLTGFVAAIYLRGIDYVQIPTTVLAAVDSSVGGKTALDLQAGKNLVGAFYQPIGVFCDTLTFKTLPKAIYADGMAEVIKYGMIQDAELFGLLEDNSIDIQQIVYRCVSIKARIVKEDEYDLGIRKILNFGHTPGHTIEKLSHYEISHGSAVAIGMVMMTEVSEKEDTVPVGTTKRLIQLLTSYGLPIRTSYTPKEMSEIAMHDKKRSKDYVDMVLLKELGDAYIKRIPVDIMQDIFSV